MSDYTSATDLFGNYRIVPKKGTERGALLQYFAEKTGHKIDYIAYKLTGIHTPDLYYIKKKCDAYKGPWAKAFFGMLKVRHPQGYPQ